MRIFILTIFITTGLEKALSLTNNLKIAIYLIIKDEESFEEKYNDYFIPFLSN
jgi:hypothetical protein